MSLVVIGLNHKNTPVEIREKFSFTDAVCRELLASLVDRVCVEEGVILSTCNRTEIYCSGVSRRDMAEKSKAVLSSFGGVELSTIEAFLYEHRDRKAVQHLFSVACGLDSMIVGEAQILGQVKKFFTDSQEQGFTGPILNKLLEGAIRTGKRARSETGICQGASSISFAVVELARRIFGDLASCRVLLLGAGKTGELTVKLLSKAGVRSITVANRTVEKARRIACTCGGQAVPFSNITLCISEADVIISSTSAPHFVLTREKIAAGLKNRKDLPLFIVDIAVPRDVEPSSGELDNVYLYNIDDLQHAVEQNLMERCNEIERVNAIINEESNIFLSFLNAREIIPIIRGMREGFENTASSELDRMLAKNSLSKKEKEMMRAFCSSLVRKLLHAPTLKLKELSEGTVDESTVEMLRNLFCKSCEEEGKS